MHDRMLEWKAAVMLFFYALSEVLGWKGILLVAWVVAMALDYISGTLAACKSGEWSSNVARDGLWHKGGMIFVIIVAGISDWIVAVMCAKLQFGLRWPGIVLPLVASWYILTESGSILENAVKMGAAVPPWLVKWLKAGILAVEKTAEKIDAQKEETNK